MSLSFALAYLAAFCQAHCAVEGYKSGFYQHPNCACVDLYDVEALQNPFMLRYGGSGGGGAESIEEFDR